MSPRPDKTTRDQHRPRIAELKAARDREHKAAEKQMAAADERMWQAIAAELDAGTVLQVDVVEATGFTRDHIAKRTKPYRTQ